MKGYFLPYAVHSGKYNMELDEKILNFAVENSLNLPIFRLYGWNPPCVTLGRNQHEENFNKEFCKQNNIDIVRRVTGGRALFHDEELTYSFVCHSSFLKNGEAVKKSYKEISGALADGLKLLGIEAEFPYEKKISTRYEYCMSLATGADLSFNGKKIVGSAQFRTQGYILQHGSIMFDYDEDKIKKIFSEKPCSDRITTIKSINSNITLEQLCTALKQGIEGYFKVQLLNQNEEFLLRQGTHV